MASTIHSTIVDDESLDSSTLLPILGTLDLEERNFFISANKNRKYLRTKILKVLDNQKEECM